MNLYKVQQINALSLAREAKAANDRDVDRFGSFPGWGIRNGYYHFKCVLARNLPRKALLEMVLLGERWSAAQLKELGLVNRVVPAAELDRATEELTSALAKKSSAVLKLGRDSFYRQQDLEFRAALEYLHSQLTLVTQSEDAQEGVRAFLEKREPEFKGR